MHTEKRIKENLSIYKGFVLSGSGREGEIPKHEYEIMEDKTEEGVRTLVLKEKDLTEHLSKVKELADTIAEKIGESDSKAMKALLFDALKHYWDEDIEQMYKRVVLSEKPPPVKARKGCFEIIIGDGRRKNADIIKLLD